MSDPLIEAYLRGNIARVQHLCEFGFLTQKRRVWNGSTVISAGGHNWFGSRKLGAIEGLESDGNGQAQTLRFVFSGVDTRLFNIAKGADRAEYIGRPVKVFNRFVDADWQQVGDLKARAAGIIDGLELSRQRAEGGSTRRTITINAQTIFYARSAGSDSYYTHSDQQRRFLGDRGLQYMSALKFTNIPFPW